MSGDRYNQCVNCNHYSYHIYTYTSVYAHISSTINASTENNEIFMFQIIMQKYQ